MIAGDHYKRNSKKRWIDDTGTDRSHRHNHFAFANRQRQHAHRVDYLTKFVDILCFYLIKKSNQIKIYLSYIHIIKSLTKIWHGMFEKERIDCTWEWVECHTKWAKSNATIVKMIELHLFGIFIIRRKSTFKDAKSKFFFVHFENLT